MCSKFRFCGYSMTKNEEKLIFLPANCIPVSFYESCGSLFERDIPSWASPDEPMNAEMIPKAFHYKNPEVVQESVSNLRKDRVGDYSEHALYRALNLLQNEYRQSDEPLGKFLVLRQFRMDLGRKKCLQLAFAQINWNTQPDFDTDFLLFHPILGIFAFEVKGTKTTAKDIGHAEEQLDKFFDFLGFLRSNKVIKADFPVFKIVFAPNFDKNLLSKTLREDGTIYLFKKEFNDLCSHDLYGSEAGVSHNVIEHASQRLLVWIKDLLNRPRHNIRGDVCEAAKVLVGMDSLVLAPHKEQRKASRKKLYALVGSKTATEQQVREIEGLKIEQQDFAQERPVHVGSMLATASSLAITSKFWKLVMLSADQQYFMKGPKHQFVFGIAGTGKTIMIAQKALELALAIRQNPTLFPAKIFVISASSFIGKYEEFFRMNDVAEIVEVLPHTYLRNRIFQKMHHEKLIIEFDEAYNKFRNSEHLKTQSPVESLASQIFSTEKAKALIRFVPFAQPIIVSHFSTDEDFINAHIFVDDAIGSLEISDEEIGPRDLTDILLGNWPLLLLPHQPEAYFWYASDLWQVMKLVSYCLLIGRFDNLDIAGKPDGNAGLKEYFERCMFGREQTEWVGLLLIHFLLSLNKESRYLHQVMRCPLEIYSIVEKFMEKEMRFEKLTLEKLFPFLTNTPKLCIPGHKEVGITRRELSLEIKANEPEKQIMAKIFEKVFSWNTSSFFPIAIIFSMRTTEHFKLNLKTAHPFLALRAPQLQNFTKNWFLQNRNLSVTTGSVEDENAQIVVELATDVYSHEWKNVVYLLCSERLEKTPGNDPADYIACSRCTSQLTILLVVIDKF